MVKEAHLLAAMFFTVSSFWGMEKYTPLPSLA